MTEDRGLVALSFEPDPITLLTANGLQLRPRLGLARVEGRVNVDEGEGGGGEGFEEGEVVGVVDLVERHGR